MLPPIQKDKEGRLTLSIRTGIFTVRSDGILLGQPTSVDVDVAEAREMVEAMAKIYPAPHGRLLLDQRKVSRRMTPAARAFLAENTDQFDKIAIIVGSAISRFLASGILMVSGRSRQVQVFENEAAAVLWLEPTATSRSA